METLTDLLQKGKLPTVTVDIKLNRENMADIAVTLILAAIAVILIHKYILSKL